MAQVFTKSMARNIIYGGSLFLFAESLAATGDRFAMYGFSSRKRDPIRFHQLKAFDESDLV